MIRRFLLGIALGVEASAGLLVGLAAIQGTIRASELSGKGESSKLEVVRLRFGRWLMLALEFQVGADILRTAVAPTWNAIAQLAAIVVIRTVLNYFLARDIAAGPTIE